MKPDKGYLSIDAAAALVKVSRNTVAKRAREGKLGAVTKDGRLFVNEAALLAYYLPKPVEVPNAR